MAIFYASRTGHGASTPSTIKHTLFRTTGTVAASTSAALIAILDALWTGHVASFAGADKRASFSITGASASTGAFGAIWQVSLAIFSTMLRAGVGGTVEVTSPICAD